MWLFLPCVVSHIAGGDGQIDECGSSFAAESLSLLSSACLKLTKNGPGSHCPETVSVSSVHSLYCPAPRNKGIQYNPMFSDRINKTMKIIQELPVHTSTA